MASKNEKIGDDLKDGEKRREFVWDREEKRGGKEMIEWKHALIWVNKTFI